MECIACVSAPGGNNSRRMLRQPKDKPLVLTETVMNCGKHGQHSLETFYGQGWRLIQVVSDEGTGARVAIFERGDSSMRN